MDTVDAISRYESGQMEQEEQVEFFQHLLDTGIVWSLQGHYGRAVSWMINEGLVKVGKDREEEEEE